MAHFDADADGVLDHFDNAPFNQNPDQRDSDNDRLGDVADSAPFDFQITVIADTDGDGVNDLDDNAPARGNANQSDQDQDGVGDVADNAPAVANSRQEDADDDGVGDAADTDDDNDGVADVAEHAPTLRSPIPDTDVQEQKGFLKFDISSWLRDDDQQIRDSGEQVTYTFTFDTDGDGQYDDAAPTWLMQSGSLLHGQVGPQYTGVTTIGISVRAQDLAGQAASDQFVLTVHGFHDPFFDYDRDGVLDNVDNAPFAWNADQSDLDGDGLGDAGDPDRSNASIPNPLPDSDGDGVNDLADNAPAEFNPQQADQDRDGVGDPADNAPQTPNPDQKDADHDGVGDVADNAPNTPNPNQTDVDEDGLGDIIDPDDDGDGRLDVAEHAPQPTGFPDTTVRDGTFAVIDLHEVLADADVTTDGGDSLVFTVAYDTDGDGADDPAPDWLRDMGGSILVTYGDEHRAGESESVLVVVTATDEAGQESSDAFLLTAQGENDAPRGGLKNVFLSNGDSFTYEIDGSFLDPEGDNLTLSAVYDTDHDGQFDDALPAWLSFDASTGMLAGTLDNGDLGMIRIRFTATDEGGASGSTTTTINLNGILDLPPFLDVPVPDITLAAGDTFVLEPGDYFSDESGFISVSYAFDTDGDGAYDDAMPDWMVFTKGTKGGGTGLSITPDADAAGSVGVQITVTDGRNHFTSDTFVVTVGEPVIHGGAGRDTLAGTPGGDTIDGGAGADEMAGGVGNDSYVVDDSNDEITEAPGEGTETVRASVNYALPDNVENLELTGDARTGAGNAMDNTLVGNDARNVLDGGAGNDVLDGGAGGDRMDGGAGADTYIVDSVVDRVSDSGGGMDTVQSSVSFSLGGGLENLTLTGTGDTKGTGNSAANVITGNEGDNVLSGGGGADTLSGAAGADRLDGGNGNDELHGGIGHDSLYGGGGADALRGGMGADLLNGGAGADLLWGGAGQDLFVFERGSGQDRVLDFADGIDLLSLEVRNLTERWIDAHVHDTAGGALIDLGGGASILLAGVSASQIGVEDFLL